ncbi:MAG: DUF5995 family protein [Pseudonocardia sp.]|nr:DUF5995 family protein [Pseudonocardia sp.]
MVSDGLRAVPSYAGGVLECLAIPPEDVPGVLERLDRLQELAESGPRGTDDGLACFNHLYREITREVLAQLDGQELFREPEFSGRLDVEFARRYFSAVRADASGLPVPRSWAVLLDRRGHTEIGPVEFAVAGVNAHVNYDLATAVVRTCTVLGRGLGRSELADHQSFNEIFAQHVGGLVDHFGTWLGRELDGAVIDKIMDGAGTLSVVLARDAAWCRAEHLWALRTRPAEYERECQAIDWRAAMIGRGVLLAGATP